MVAAFSDFGVLKAGTPLGYRLDASQRGATRRKGAKDQQHDWETAALCSPWISSPPTLRLDAVAEQDPRDQPDPEQYVDNDDEAVRRNREERPGLLTPRRFIGRHHRMNPTEIATFWSASSGTADVIAATPATMDTETVST